MITILILLINPGGLHCYLLMFTTLQGRCHQLNFREEETKAQTGYSVTNGIQQGQGIAGFEFVCLTPKSVSSQGHAVNTFRWSWGTVYRGQHKMKSRPPVFQDRNYSSLTPGKAVFQDRNYSSLTPTEGCCFAYLMNTLQRHNISPQREPFLHLTRKVQTSLQPHL